MQKQDFTDNTYSLAKGLQHTNIAKEYFEDLHRNTSKEVKLMFSQFVNKCDWIIKNIRDRIGDESRVILKSELSDSLAFDSINDKLIKLTTQQRSLVETVIDSFINGEEFEIVDESLKVA
jgi:dGTP triphosphohydrolase